MAAENQLKVQFLTPSDKIHEDFILHDAGDLGHPWRRDGASLTSSHQHLTCKQVRDVWEGRERFK